jgi:hypothetical protein
MSLDSHLDQLGFELIQERRGGAKRFARRSNPYLHQWVLIHPDGTAEFTWELELGAYLKAKGFHISVQDELSLLLFPSGEARGPADPNWLDDRLAEADGALDAVDLASGG